MVYVPFFLEFLVEKFKKKIALAVYDRAKAYNIFQGGQLWRIKFFVNIAEPIGPQYTRLQMRVAAQKVLQNNMKFLMAMNKVSIIVNTAELTVLQYTRLQMRVVVQKAQLETTNRMLDRKNPNMYADIAELTVLQYTHLQMRVVAQKAQLETISPPANLTFPGFLPGNCVVKK